MIRALLSIDRLIAIVRDGGVVKTGVDVYDRDGTLLLAGDVRVDQVRTLEIIRRSGVRKVPLTKDGGVFDRLGNEIPSGRPDRLDPQPLALGPGPAIPDVENRVKEIQEIRKEAEIKFARARACVKTAVTQIRQTQGQFDVGAVQEQVADMTGFSLRAGHPGAYLGRELFSFEDYLSIHAVNVCTLGASVVRQFNQGFSAAVEAALWPLESRMPGSFSYYLTEDMDQIFLGLLVYDLGKALVPEKLLNKSAALTRDEFDLIKRHSYEFGARILETNGLAHPVVSNMVLYHHAPIFNGETGGYPCNRPVSEIPLYVKICKLLDIYDAMVSRTCYQEARNQANATAELFRTYVKKDAMLQFVLQAFVRSIGLYPPGSIVYLKNGQLAYVLDDKGPILLPFTDPRGNALDNRPDPFDARNRDNSFQVDAGKSVQTPVAVFDLLPGYIRTLVCPPA